MYKNCIFAEKTESMESELRKLQQKCLEILDIIDNICRKHGIQYSLCGGSVVGAHLYKGFLPWDDDIDLMMTRENYNKFIDIASSELPQGFSLFCYQHSEYASQLHLGFAKVMNENTTFVENNGDITGIFVDITVYDKIPNNFLRHIDLFLYKRAQMISTGKLPGNSIKNHIRSFLLDTVFSDYGAYMTFFQKILEMLGHTSNYTYRELCGPYYFVSMIPYRPSIFENYTTIEFEGKDIMIVRDYIEYLQTRYKRTDFVEPKEKQTPSHYGHVEFEIPYKEYMKEHKKY